MTQIIYHYTDRLSAADIRRDKIIKAYPIGLHLDLLANDEPVMTRPLCWLTVDSVMETTILSKLLAGGWRREFVGDIVRFSVTESSEFLTLLEFMKSSQIPLNRFTNMISTSIMSGSNPGDWRLSLREIPASEWLSVEILSGISEDQMTRWTELKG